MNVDSFRRLVSSVAERPGMYMLTLGEYGSLALGYAAALRDAGVVEGLLTDEFSEWLCAREQAPNVGWVAHIQRRYGDGEAAIKEAGGFWAEWFDARAGTA